MRVRIQDLFQAKQIVFTGNEPWIEQIAKDLPTRPTATPRKITGMVELKMDSAGFVYGRGHIKHTPALSCSRCDHDIDWQINADINVSWRPPFESHAPRELSLSSEDLDVYFIEDGAVDLEQLVNDTIQCALPDQTFRTEVDLDACEYCSMSPNNPLVFPENHGQSTETNHKASPFSILARLGNSSTSDASK